MKNQLETSIVRFFATNGVVVGTGFLVAEDILLTCAHVITATMHRDEDPLALPTTAIRLDFPLVTPQFMYTAHVLFWQPPQNNGGGDVAILRLDSHPPEETRGIRLVADENLWGHNFRAYGFPNLHDNGVWTSGKLRAREASGWIQVEDIKESGFRVQRGFSGGAVWDEQLNGVVGMVVAAEEDPTIRAAYIIPTDVLIKVYPQLSLQTVPACPYRGLSAFREEDALYFFGRDTFVQQMVDAVRRKPLLAIIGPSGSGKSSVVFAGLLPRLRKEGSWFIVSFRPGRRPFRSLAAALMPLLEPQRSETDRLTEISKLAHRLQQDELALQDVIELIMHRLVGTHLLLFIDEFEELYTLCQESEVQLHFLDELLTTIQEAPRQRTFSFNLVLTLRADFIRQALFYRPFADALQYADLKLGPMNRKELQDVIRKPAGKLHVQIEEGLTERILKEVSREPSHLPLLEFALTLLWIKQKEGKLTHRTYEEIGGVEKALADHAEDIYSRLDEREQLQAQRIFVQLVYPGEGTEDTRRLATHTEVGEDNWELVAHLADARLIVSGQDTTTGEETIELVHEALITGWQRLREWVEENREFRTWQERLRTVLHQWEKNARDDGGLLRGALLVEAIAWMRLRPESISQQERELLETSQNHQEEETKRWKLLYEEAERQRKNAERVLQQLKASYQAARELSTITEMEQIEQAYSTVLHIAEEYTQSEGAIFRYDSSTNELVLIRGPEHLFEAEQNTMVKQSTETSTLLEESSPSELAVPILIGDRVDGVLNLKHKDTSYFHEIDIMFMEWLAYQLASAIHRQEIMQEHQEFKQRTLAAEEMSSFGQAAFEVVHRLGNDLGLVRIYIKTIRSVLDKQGISDVYIVRNLENIEKSVGSVLAFSSQLKQDLVNSNLEKDFISISPQSLFEDVQTQITFPPLIKVSIEIDENVDDIRADHKSVIYILYQLIINAVEAMPAGGEIILRAYNSNHDVALEIADTGVGISSQHQTRIFQLFFSTKGSSGFGLWSARRHALKNHGDIKVESQPGQGTTFKLLLPKVGTKIL